MKFWGAVVPAGKPLKVKPGRDYRIHVSQASLHEGNNGETVLLYVKTVDGKKVVIGTLCEETIPQISFSLVFKKDFELSHSSKGSVHFHGHKSRVSTTLLGRAQRLTHLVRSRDPVTKSYLTSLSKEEGETSSFPSYLGINTPQPQPDDETFLLPDVMLIQRIDQYAQKSDVEKFLINNGVRGSKVHMLLDSSRRVPKQVAVVELASADDLPRAMGLSGTLMYTAATGKRSPVFCERKNNRLRVYFLCGYDFNLSEDEIIRQVTEAFTSDTPDSPFVMKVFIPPLISRSFCYIIMGNVTDLNWRPLFEVETVGGKKVMLEQITPIGSVFKPILDALRQ
ncbi:Nucleoplasmin-like domain-containing protein [Hirschfeldia incana]|nr:Nucleoplasmin-like domain-containing protein [Hirschfeldia incana]KAJ0263338.1 Nucleoplasmin-like domain-containing protein [Hirschfeldia incana]